MNKKAAMAVIISFLLVSVEAASLVGLAEANPIRIVSGVPRIQLTSPQPMLYHEDAVTLSFHGNNVDWGTVEYSKIKYWLDGELKGILDSALQAAEVFSVNLTGIKDGLHTLEVTATVTVKSLRELTGGGIATVLWAPSTATSSGQLNFTIDANPPSIVIISLQNRTFETVDVPLNFTVNEPVSALSYSLDEKSNVTFTNVVMAHIYGKDNYYFVLNGLEEDSHSLKIYAKDAAGYTGESETYYFTVNTQPTPTPSPSPTPTATAPPSSAEMPLFSMPKEYLNYTIITRDGTPWAVIDGVYPIYCFNADEQDTIAMVYPTPPGTTNISIRLNGVLLNWSDFAEQYPDALHHTAIGDWSMIGTAFEPSSNFVLSIHYEHPIMQANESYQFLYDLNISPYLSALSPSSTAYFTLKIDDAYSNIKVFTVPSDSIRNPLEYASQGRGALREVTFAVTSEYAKTLPGDVIVTFNEASTENQSSPIATVELVLGVALFVATATLLAVVLAGKKKRARMLL